MNFSKIEYIVVLITTSSLDEAKRIGTSLIDNKLAACTNIISSVESIFRWQGEVCNEKEAMLIVKTRRGIFNDLQSKVKELHSYDVPEIIALPILDGNSDYLKWLDSSINQND